MKRRVALIILYDSDGRILLQDRKGISKWGEKWGYFGGQIEQGETPEDAVIRETKEELSYGLKEYKFIGEIITSDQRGIIERHVFISPFPGFSKLKQVEGEAMQLFTLAEAKEKKKVFGDDKVIQKLKEIGLPPKLL